MTEEDGAACMNCYLMEIGEVDPQDGRCEKCGKRAANPLLGIAWDEKEKEVQKV